MGQEEAKGQTNELARVFNDSYERVMRGPGKKSGEFFVAFYDLLIAESDEAVSKLRNINMTEQVRMLQSSFTLLLNFYVTDRQDDHLLKLAERHGNRGVDIPPGLYSVWLDCLIETVRQFDSKFNEEVATAWRTVFSKGIEFMTSRYEGE